MREDTPPLQQDAGEMRRLGYRIIDLLVDRYEQARNAIPWQGATRAELDALVREAAPATGRGADAVIDRLFDDVVSRGARVDHPRFLAFVPGAPVWPAVLGDLIAAGTNVFQGTWLASSGVSALELQVLDWFAEWLGCDAGTSGLLVSGGSAANLTAIACARLHRFGAHSPDAVIYCSAETHSSVPRAARILGFAADRIRTVAVADDQRIDTAALLRSMQADRAAGLVPFLVVANAGTTSTGAVDPLVELADICAAEGAWLHIDAAYGGFAALTDEGRGLLRGIERGDSITLDPHKWLYQTFEAGCLLVRRGHLLEDVFRVLPPYLQDAALPQHDGDSPASTAPLPVNFADRGIQLTRSARVLKIWLAIQLLGVDAFRAAIGECLRLARYAEARIRRSPVLELLAPARLGIVCFRRRTPHGEDDDAGNERLLRALLASGVGMISSTRVDGAYALRFCVLNYRTTERDLDAIIDWIEAYREDRRHG